MRLKQFVPGLLVLIVAGTPFAWKLWQGRQQTTQDTVAVTQIKGPAVILFKGDNSAGCRAIHQLVDQAAARYGKTINFTQLDWSADNPLIEKYQVRFLPTVIFIDQHDKEAGRIMGESPAVQQKLEQALAQVNKLSGQ